ncbi:MAG: YeeE/YedE thiosulfate transporter family protein, partial [Aigarchaeota archaeon]|nr:YeeE/YedE thiosulfate transporter family protein [Aigarchaeota archaeon]
MGVRIYVSAALIGVVSVALGYSMYLVAGRGTIWGITTGESKLGGLFWRALGLPVDQLTYYKQFRLMNPLEDPTQAIVLSVLIGGLSASMLTKSFAVRHFPNRWMAVQAVLGGFLLGYGARLAFGCNIGNFLSGWATGGVHAAVFTATLLPGTWAGFRLTEALFATRAAPRRYSVTLPLRAQRWLGLGVVASSLALVPLMSPL